MPRNPTPRAPAIRIAARTIALAGALALPLMVGACSSMWGDNASTAAPPGDSPRTTVTNH